VALTFFEKVLQVVAKIPHGKTMSYKQVARLAGSSNACRAVGNIERLSGGWKYFE